ncbi:MAG: hypothetical protein NVSMB29_09620 [Candidatus Dormibacteria bacterium]
MSADRWRPIQSAGLGIAAASVVLEESNAQGGNAAACHAQMHTMGTVPGGWRLRGQKAFTSRAQQSDLMLLIARTTPLAEVSRRRDGMSVFSSSTCARQALS